MEHMSINIVDSNFAMFNEPTEDVYSNLLTMISQTFKDGPEFGFESQFDDEEENDRDAVHSSHIDNNGARSQVKKYEDGESHVTGEERTLEVARLNNLSRSLIKLERFNDSREAASEALKLDPRNWEAFYNRYVILLQTLFLNCFAVAFSHLFMHTPFGTSNCALCMYLISELDL